MQSVMTINSGSSNLRFALFRVGESLAQILTGKFDRIGLPISTPCSTTRSRAWQSCCLSRVATRRRAFKNYLSTGQIYLYDNPLLKQPLKLAHIKPRLLGHWGTTPGLNFEG